MCSRFCLTSSPHTVRGHFGYDGGHDFPPRYNIAPTQPVAVVRHDHGGRRELALVRWGLIPSWSKDPTARAPLFNARAETAAEKPSFRGSLRHRRCLVPADGYYEWSGPSGARTAYLIRPAASGPMALAGLWEHWLGADGSEIETLAILTIAANADVADIAERMPVILPPAGYDAWLDTSPGTSSAITGLLKPAAGGLLITHAIGPAINNPAVDSTELAAEIAPMLH